MHDLLRKRKNWCVFKLKPLNSSGSPPKPVCKIVRNNNLYRFYVQMMGEKDDDLMEHCRAEL